MINLKLLNKGLGGVLKPNEFMMLFIIANTISWRKENRTKIYNEFLADKMNISSKQVERITNSLVEKGFINKELIQESKTKKSLYYSLNLDKNVSKNAQNLDKNVLSNNINIKENKIKKELIEKEDDFLKFLNS